MVEPGWVDLSWDLCGSWVTFVHGSHIIPPTTFGRVDVENKQGWMLTRAPEPKWHPW